MCEVLHFDSQESTMVQFHTHTHTPVIETHVMSDSATHVLECSLSLRFSVVITAYSKYMLCHIRARKKAVVLLFVKHVNQRGRINTETEPDYRALQFASFVYGSGRFAHTSGIRLRIRVMTLIWPAAGRYEARTENCPLI